MVNIDDAIATNNALKQEAWDWFLHTVSGDATKADLAALRRWCAQSPRHAEAFAQASRTWRALGPAIETAVRQDGLARAGQRPVTQRPIGRRAFLGGALGASAAVAAGVLVARPPLGLWPSFSQLAADYRTVTGEQRRIALADHLSVEMNTRTSLNVYPAAGNTDRIELVAGEAVIAAGARPVEVITEHGRIWARAAEFNVRRYEYPETCVTCLDGTVRVGYREQTVTVQQGQQVSYDGRGPGPVTAIDPAVVTGWREGILQFRNEPLSRVIAEINRYRPGTIILMNSDLGERRVSARFELDRLDSVVTQLREAFGAEVTSLPGGVTLVS